MEVDLTPNFSFSSDGNYIVFSSSSPIIYDIRKQKIHKIVNELQCKAVFHNKKNDIIIVDGNCNIILYNIKDGKIVQQQLCNNAEKINFNNIEDVIISNDYKYIAVHIHFNDFRNLRYSTINVYQTDDLKLINSFNISTFNNSCSILFTDDYKILYRGADYYEMRDLFDNNIVKTTVPSSMCIFDCNNGRLLYDGAYIIY